MSIWALPGPVPDYAAFAIAQRLAGNTPDDAAIEMTYRGLDFVASDAIAIATAGIASVYIDGVEHPGWSMLQVPRGAVVHMGPVQQVRGYLAVRGGFDLPLVMGSRSTDFTAAIGGLLGRSLRAGDALNLKAPATGTMAAYAQIPSYRA